MAAAVLSFVLLGAAPPARAVSLLEQAASQRAAGHFDKAIAAANQAIKADPKNYQAYHLLFTIYMDRGDRAKASRLLSTMEERFGQKEELLALMGDFEFLEGRLHTAKSHYDRCLRLADANPSCLMGAASVHFRRKEWDKGIELLTPKVAKLPERAYFYNFIASLYIQKGENNTALIYLNKAILDDPTYLATYVNAADAFNKLRRYHDALVFIETVEKETPTSVLALLNKGIALLGLNRIESAFETFQRALALAPNHPVALFNKGLCLERLGQAAAAKKAMEEALRNAEDQPDLKAKIQRRMKGGG